MSVHTTQCPHVIVVAVLACLDDLWGFAGRAIHEFFFCCFFVWSSSWTASARGWRRGVSEFQFSSSIFYYFLNPDSVFYCLMPGLPNSLTHSVLPQQKPLMPARSTPLLPPPGRGSTHGIKTVHTTH